MSGESGEVISTLIVVVVDVLERGGSFQAVWDSLVGWLLSSLAEIVLCTAM